MDNPYNGHIHSGMRKQLRRRVEYLREKRQTDTKIPKGRQSYVNSEIMALEYALEALLFIEKGKQQEKVRAMNELDMVLYGAARRKGLGGKAKMREISSTDIGDYITERLERLENE